jgi:dTDP-glucose 4,6-dehydratase
MNLRRKYLLLGGSGVLGTELQKTQELYNIQYHAPSSCLLDVEEEDVMGQSYYHTYGLPVITTRCCNVFGPRQLKEKLIPKAITNLLTGKKIPVYGKGEQIREWIYVKDVFYAVKHIIENGLAGEVYNIGSGQEIKNIDLVYKILSIFDESTNKIEFVQDRLGHDFRYALDTTKLNGIGWNSKYNLEDALEHTVGWFRANDWACRK